jgi:hypothetical protein
MPTVPFKESKAEIDSLSNIKSISSFGREASNECSDILPIPILVVPFR